MFDEFIKLDKYLKRIILKYAETSIRYKIFTAFFKNKEYDYVACAHKYNYMGPTIIRCNKNNNWFRNKTCLYYFKYKMNVLQGVAKCNINVKYVLYINIKLKPNNIFKIEIALIYGTKNNINKLTFDVIHHNNYEQLYEILYYGFQISLFDKTENIYKKCETKMLNKFLKYSKYLREKTQPIYLLAFDNNANILKIRSCSYVNSIIFSTLQKKNKQKFIIVDNQNNL